jgi:hypothetical protein
MEETKVQKYRKDYYQKNKEKIKNQTKKYYHDNKDFIIQSQLKYYHDNKELIKQSQSKYSNTYYETIGAYKRKSYSYNNKITANRFAKQQEEIEKRREIYFKTEETKGV